MYFSIICRRSSSYINNSLTEKIVETTGSSSSNGYGYVTFEKNGYKLLRVYVTSSDLTLLQVNAENGFRLMHNSESAFNVALNTPFNYVATWFKN